MIKALIFCGIFAIMCVIVKLIVVVLQRTFPKIVDTLLYKPLELFKNRRY